MPILTCALVSRTISWCHIGPISPLSEQFSVKLRYTMRSIYVISLTAVVIANAAVAQVRVAWVQLGPGAKYRHAQYSKGKQCPGILIDGRAAPMRPRTPVPDGFPTLCEASIPAGTRAASMDGKTLALPAAEFKRIAVVGDTGCRVRVKASTGESEIQNCAEDWHFKSLADAAAARKPDLVIHTGDYVYRENEGFGWNSWDADFLQPANSLLRTAPWIFVRGNHESCKDGGTGWFYLLEARPYGGSCTTESSEPYLVNAGKNPVSSVGLVCGGGAEFKTEASDRVCCAVEVDRRGGN